MVENVATDHGGDPSGASDSTQAIIDATNAATPNGTVYFPSGDYRIGSTTRFPIEPPAGTAWEGVTWEGNSFSDTRVFLDDSHGGEFAWMWYAIDDPINDATWRNLHLDFQGQAQSADGAGAGGLIIDIDNGSGNYLVEDCILEDSINAAFQLTGDQNSVVRRTRFKNTGSDTEDVAGHDFNIRTNSATTHTLEDSEIVGTAGASINTGDTIDQNYDDITIKNCYMEAARIVKHKESTAAISFDRLNFKGIATSAFPSTDGFAANTSDYVHNTPVTITNSVVDFRGMGEDSGPGINYAAPLGTDGNTTVTVDNCDFYHPDEDGDKSFGDRRGVGLHFVSSDEYVLDIGDVYVEGESSDIDVVFFDSTLSGSADLIRSFGCRRLGTTNSVSVNTHENNTQTPLDPAVPSQSEVGPGTGESATEKPLQSGAVRVVSGSVAPHSGSL